MGAVGFWQPIFSASCQELLIFLIPPPDWTSIKGVAEEDAEVGCGGEMGGDFPSGHLFREERREASVPAEERFVCSLDESILSLLSLLSLFSLLSLHRQLAASQENVLLCSLAENRAAALGKL